MSAPTLADDHDLGTTVASINRGLLRRLHDGALKPNEQAALVRAEEIAHLEAQGKTVKEMAAHFGVSHALFRQWTQANRYRLLRQHLARQGQSQVVDTAGALRRQRDRQRFDGNTGHALDWFDQAFRRHAKADEKRGIKKGDFENMDRAERATKLVAGAQGWLEPIPQHAKPKELASGVIQAQMQGIRAADQREMVVRVTTPGGETVEVGMRERAGEDAP